MNKKRILKSAVSKAKPDGKGGTDTSSQTTSNSGSNNSSTVTDYINGIIPYNTLPSSVSSYTPTPTKTTSPTQPLYQDNATDPTISVDPTPNGMMPYLYNQLAGGNMAYNPETQQINDPLGQQKQAQANAKPQDGTTQTKDKLPQASITPDITKIRNWRNSIKTKSKRLSMA